MKRREHSVRRSARLSSVNDNARRREDEMLGDALFRRKLYGGSWFAYDYDKKEQEVRL